MAGAGDGTLASRAQVNPANVALLPPMPDEQLTFPGSPPRQSPLAFQVGVCSHRMLSLVSSLRT